MRWFSCEADDMVFEQECSYCSLFVHVVNGACKRDDERDPGIKDDFYVP